LPPPARKGAKVLRVVVDTNTIVSGLLWRGKPYDPFRAAGRNEVIFCTSPALLAELEDVLPRSKFTARWRKLGLNWAAALRSFRDAAQIFRASPLPRNVITADPDDCARCSIRSLEVIWANRTSSAKAIKMKTRTRRWLYAKPVTTHFQTLNEHPCASIQYRKARYPRPHAC